MRLLKTFDRVPDDFNWEKRISRQAMRAIVINSDEQILMMYSGRFNNYKFPGGGIDPDESNHDALKRELLEETGFRISKVYEPLGIIIERNPDKFQTDTLFEMTSYYYRCAVEGEQTPPALTESETALGLECRWVALQDALTANNIAANAPDTSFWNTREALMLEYLLSANIV